MRAKKNFLDTHTKMEEVESGFISFLLQSMGTDIETHRGSVHNVRDSGTHSPEAQGALQKRRQKGHQSQGK